MTTLQYAEHLLKKFEPLSLGYTLDVIYYLGGQDDDIFFKGTRHTIAELLCTLYSNYRPREIHIRFYGGPPTRGRWVVGSVYSYVLDKIALKITNDGYMEARRVLKYGSN
jgi:hypothetical protein